jgi:glycosyltransferase involved in cell wall biosynthesis
MSKIKLLAIPSDNHGVGKYRILDPYKFIGNHFSDDVHVDISFNVEDNDSVFLDYDVVVFHSFIHKLSAEKNLERISWLRSKGIKVIMDIDDFWNVDQRHPMFGQLKANKVPETKVSFMRSVDYITCTTELFATEIKNKLGVKNVIVFPNAIDENEAQFKPEKTESDRVRFGWLGGSSHLHDLELLKQGIDGVLNQFKDKTQFVLCGFDLRGTVNEINKQTNEVRQRPVRPEETVWSKYEQFFTSNYKYIDEEYKQYLLTYNQTDYPNSDVSYRRRWTQEINKYAFNYNHFDVSLAPLYESYFNACKSELKVIEAGFHKKAIISSDVKPYSTILTTSINQGVYNNTGNALLVEPRKNHKDWTKHMKRLIESPSMIEDLGNKLYETVKDKYSLKNVCKDRVDFLKIFVGK